MGDSVVISATMPDWNRERIRHWWDPARQLLRSIRGYQKWRARGGLLGPFLSRFYVLRHGFWSVVSGADISLNCRLEGGLLLPHPNGIVIHPDARVGPNCLIFQQVTLGVRRGRPGTPTLGGHVHVGAGAKVLGGIVIGDHACIGANAVVICDVPAGAVAIGVPARIIEGGAPDA